MEVISRRSSLNQEFVIKSMPCRSKNCRDDDFDSSCDKNSLIYYDRLKITATIVLVIGHLIFCSGLFYPIIILQDGIYYDHSIFVPHSETLLHSIKTLFNQGAYTTLFIALAFSVTLPFIKLGLTVYAVYKSFHYKRMGIDIIRSFNFNNIDRVRDVGRTCYWILFSLKAICKFQFVDSVIILFNVAFLRNNFIVASSGRGVACLIIYCLISIPCTQLIYYSFTKESKILNKWVNKVADMKEEERRAGYSFILTEMLVVFFTLIIIFASTIVLSHESLFFVGVTIDKAKNLIIAGVDYTYKDVISILHDGSLYVFSFFIFMILGIVVPIVQALVFLLGIIVYNIQLGVSPILALRIFSGYASCIKKVLFKWARMFLVIANILSDWACVDVVALALIATRSSLITSPRVVPRIPVNRSISAFYMLMAFGLSSFSLQILLNHKFVNDMIESDGNDIRDGSNTLGANNDRTTNVASKEKATKDKERETKEKILTSNASNDKKTSGNELDNLSMGSFSVGNLSLHDLSLSNSQDHQSLIDNSLDHSHSLNANFSLNSTNSLNPKCLQCESAKSRLTVFKFVVNTIIALLVLFNLIYAYKHNISPVVFDVVEFQKRMDSMNNEIFNVVHQRISSSIGECSKDNIKAPEPCTNMGNIYTLDKVIYFNIPWITGINTIMLTGAKVESIGDRIAFFFMFRFGNLSIYSIVGSYILTHYQELYRGYGTCCGNDVGMNIALSLKCSNSEPVIREIAVDLIHLSNVQLSAIVERMVNTFVDVRKLMDSKMTEEANKFLDPDNKFIFYQNMSLSLQDLVNYLVKINAPAGLICQKDVYAPSAQ